MRKQFLADQSQLTLKYGVNPHQKPAQVFIANGQLPLTGIKIIYN